MCVYIHVYMCVYTHTMEYYSTIKKDKILPFATTWPDLEDIILSEISQTPYDLTFKWNLKTKITSSLIQRTEWRLPRWDGAGGKVKAGQKSQTFRYKIKKSWGCNVQHDDYS